VEHLKARYGSHRTLVVQMAAEGVAIDLPDVEEVRREDARIWLRFQPEQISAPRLIADLAARYPVTDLSLAQADLEGIIRQIYQERQVRDVVALA
jgi:ABC-2 type transport system ATP-binding protein